MHNSVFSCISLVAGTAFKAITTVAELGAQRLNLSLTISNYYVTLLIIRNIYDCIGWISHLGPFSRYLTLRWRATTKYISSVAEFLLLRSGGPKFPG